MNPDFQNNPEPFWKKVTKKVFKTVTYRYLPNCENSKFDDLIIRMYELIINSYKNTLIQFN